MGDKTGIQWTDATWNPLTGCKAVSPGCDHCYAASQASGRLKNTPAYVGLAEGGRFNGTIRLLQDRLDQPLRWKRPRRIFVNSMSDLFHEDVPAEFIAKVFAVMVCAQRHTFQVLTKRPQRMAHLLGSEAFFELYDIEVTALLQSESWSGTVEETPTVPQEKGWWREDDGWPHTMLHPPWPAPNVWLGTSIESQTYSFRARHLLNTPAAVRFVSAEPLLGPVDLPEYFDAYSIAGIDWVICGGESGREARPMHPGWARGLRDQCTEAGVAFHFKQWGEWAPGTETGARTTSTGSTPSGGLKYRLLDLDGAEHSTNDLASFTLPAGWANMVRVGKKAAGRELDGRTWDEWPS